MVYTRQTQFCNIMQSHVCKPSSHIYAIDGTQGFCNHAQYSYSDRFNGQCISLRFSLNVIGYLVNALIKYMEDVAVTCRATVSQYEGLIRRKIQIYSF